MLASVVKTMRPHALEFGRVVDLPHRLVRLVDRVGERAAARWRGFISNWASTALPKVSAVMPVPSEMKKTVRVVHGVALRPCPAARATLPRLQSGPLSGIRFPGPHIPSPMHAASAPKATTTIVPCRLHAAPVSTSGAFPCLHFSTRPPWSYRLKT